MQGRGEKGRDLAIRIDLLGTRSKRGDRRQPAPVNIGLKNDKDSLRVGASIIHTPLAFLGVSLIPESFDVFVGVKTALGDQTAFQRGTLASIRLSIYGLGPETYR